METTNGTTTHAYINISKKSRHTIFSIPSLSSWWHPHGWVTIKENVLFQWALVVSLGEEHCTQQHALWNPILRN